MTALAYIAQAAVYQTANTIDHGEKPAVPSAILKSQLTEFQRQMILGDAMDIHGGKAVTLGPRNYLGIGYSANPVAITVEGANIMTRNLMIFGQGAIRCHPHVLTELAAKEMPTTFAPSTQAFFGHAGLIFGNAARALTQGLGIGRPAVPFDATSPPPMPGRSRGSPPVSGSARTRPWPASAHRSSSARCSRHASATCSPTSTSPPW
jgi:acyl-CoA dehydrogenase